MPAPTGSEAVPRKARFMMQIQPCDEPACPHPLR
jgi:hypothetical protein